MEQILRKWASFVTDIYHKYIAINALFIFKYIYYQCLTWPKLTIYYLSLQESLIRRTVWFQRRQKCNITTIFFWIISAKSFLSSYKTVLLSNYKLPFPLYKRLNCLNNLIRLNMTIFSVVCSYIVLIIKWKQDQFQRL